MWKFYDDNKERIVESVEFTEGKEKEAAQLKKRVWFALVVSFALWLFAIFRDFIMEKLS
jgi:hypothetical protein